MNMEWLGRGGNVVALADNIWLPMKDCSGITFICYEDGGATDITIQEATDGSGSGNVDLDVVDRYYTSNGVGGAWSLQTQPADALVEPTDVAAQDAAAIYVGADQMSDGFTHIRCDSDTADTPPVVMAILHDLVVQRAPENLAALV
jgi:hypothetical protein